MAYKIDLKKKKKEFFFHRQRTQQGFNSWTWTGLDYQYLQEKCALLNPGLNLHWTQRMALKYTTFLIKTFYSVINSLTNLMVFSYQNQRTSQVSSYQPVKKEIKYKGRNEIYSPLFPLEEWFRRGQISSETKHIGTSITFFPILIKCKRDK